MWEFPSNQEFIGAVGFHIFFTLVALIFCIISWANFLSGKSDTEQQVQDSKSKVVSDESLKNVIVGVITALIVIFSSCGMATRYSEASKCRNLDLAQVKALRIKKMDIEKSVTGAAIEFNDREIIKEGLSSLRSAYHRDRNKDHFAKGYRLQLVMENDPQSEFYVDYFSETEKGKEANVVIPHCNTNSNGFNVDGVGVFSSSNFGDWLRKYIEPQFKK